MSTTVHEPSVYARKTCWAQVPIQRTRHSRSISGSLGRSLSHALGRTLSRGSGLRRSSSGAARAAETPRREEGTPALQGGGSLGSQQPRRDFSKDSNGAAKERGEQPAAAGGAGGRATSVDKDTDRAAAVERSAAAMSASEDAVGPCGSGEGGAPAPHARTASLGSVHVHARRCAPPATSHFTDLCVLFLFITQALSPFLCSPAAGDLYDLKSSPVVKALKQGDYL